MDAKADSEPKNQPSPWRFIPMAQYKNPAEPTTETVRKGVLRLWEGLRKDKEEGKEEEEFVIEGKELSTAPRDLLRQAVPRPDWSELAPALHEAVSDRLKLDRWGSGLCVVAYAPSSGTPEAIIHLANEQKWQLAEAPAYEHLLRGSGAWRIPGLADDEHNHHVPLVIPRLERCYLRHHNGLELIRGLIDALLLRNRASLIGCSSWAWAYLSRALRLESILSAPLVLEAVDRERLQLWLQRLASGQGKPDFLFRQADNGKFVIPPPADTQPDSEQSQGEGGQAAENQGTEKTTNFLGHVASYSRGIPEVALAAWRHSLRVVASGEVEKGARDEKALDRGRTIWVKPWYQLDFPEIPAMADRNYMFILHAILLHGSLPADILGHLLAMSSMDVMAILWILRNAGLVETEGETGAWRVTPLGYPAVRRFLEGEGYLVDGI